MSKRHIGIVSAACLVFLLTACGNGRPAAEHARHEHGNGDLQEKTASVQTLPSFLRNQPEEMRTAYRLAAETVDTLQWIPCYCGCGESASHKSNVNCFIKEMGSDGSVTWDDHGTRCNVCLEIAVVSYKLKEQGKAAKEIRETIDQAYGKGYAKPTPTPMPS
ncbi:PCYCGC motif-containing (lipo)protein [Paenibacillus flagellatus]|uniref:Lipoprotein n=1 Tax=Paenibacillus flagellatus TaxID=2211139 RepID=A0A2V5KC09_9BACL|nr:PCYCGC motif-containing (lipo)protein [Paenibacillus flagellatus]PYI57119.1 hypothetical protein DLM86_01345 [Paenibacillus flagellatus]